MRDRRDTQYDDVFAADEASDGEPQNDELAEGNYYTLKRGGGTFVS